MTKKHSKSTGRSIRILGARENTLKGFDLEIERGRLITVVGPSGSGKSTLIFQTLAAESAARAQLLDGTGRGRQAISRPDCDLITGLPFCTTVSQRAMHRSPRSTVATSTGLHSIIRHLTISHGETRCGCGEPVVRTDRDLLLKYLLEYHRRVKISVMAVVGREPLPNLHHLEKALALEGIRHVEIQPLPGEPRRVRPLRGLGGLDPNGIHAIIVELGASEAASGPKGKALEDFVGSAYQLGQKGVIVRIPGATAKAPRIEIDTGLQAVCVSCGAVHRLPDESWLSFNSHPTRSGRCTTCLGLGQVEDVDMGSLVPDQSLSFDRGCFALRRERGSFKFLSIREDVVRGVLGAEARLPFRRISDAARNKILYGMGEVRVLPLDVSGRSSGAKVRFHGLIPTLHGLLGKEGEPAAYAREFVSLHRCPACNGSRFRPEVTHYRYGSAPFTEILGLEVDAAVQFMEGQASRGRTAERPWIDAALRVLISLRRAGLKYISLDRSLSTLSGGELQRLKIAESLHRGLTGAAYILDEPSLGLHAADGADLVKVVCELRETGNTVIVADHDPIFRDAADHVVALGPGAGAAGGALIDPSKEPKGISFRVQSAARRSGDILEIDGCSANNLRDVSACFPLGAITCVTGVSGSGKSSFVHGCLVPAVAEFVASGRKQGRAWAKLSGAESIRSVVTLRQQPIGTSMASAVATYLEIYDAIRELFASTEAARAKGLLPGHFSFNRPEGRCPVCSGRGVLISDTGDSDPHPPRCDACQGARFMSSILDVLWNGLSIGDVLQMEAAHAVEAFTGIDSVSAPLHKLVELGAGHLQLGRATPTLSGGEAQRLKLAKSLAGAEGRKGGLLLVLDEPTAGLHRSDVARLADMLDKLRDGGANTVVIIEHDLDLISTADWIVDFGPGAGRHGGEVVHCGTQKDLRACRRSKTGQALLGGTQISRKGKTPSSSPRTQSIGVVRADPEGDPLQQSVQRFRAAMRRSDRTSWDDDTEGLDGGIRPVFQLEHDAHRFGGEMTLVDVLGLRQQIQRVLFPHVKAASSVSGRLTPAMLDKRPGSPGACLHCNGHGTLESCDESLVIRSAKAPLLSPAFFTREAGELLKAISSRTSKALDRFTAEGLIIPERFISDRMVRGLVLHGVPGKRFRIAGRGGEKDADYLEWTGLITLVLDRLHLSNNQKWREQVKRGIRKVQCFACSGTGYEPHISEAEVFGISVPTFMSVSTLERSSVLLRKHAKDRRGQILADLLDDLVAVGAGSMPLERAWRDMSDELRELVRVVALDKLRLSEASHLIALREDKSVRRILNSIAEDCEVVVTAPF